MQHAAYADSYLGKVEGRFIMTSFLSASTFCFNFSKMPTLSPFQNLPIHIAEAIYAHCDRSNRRFRSYTPSSRFISKKDLWLVLHDVCYFWRILALEFLHSEVTLKLTADLVGNEFECVRLLQSMEERRAEIVPHVLNVNIVIDDITERPSEEQFLALNRIWPEDIVFTKARSLNFSITNSTKAEKATGTSDYSIYFSWLVQRIRLSLPNLRSAAFTFGYETVFSIDPQTLLSSEWDAGSFLSTLFIKAGFRSYVSSPVYQANDRLFEQRIPELTRIRSDHPYDNEFSCEIIRKSAATLESLILEDQECGFLKKMVCLGGGRFKIYPRLREIEILGNSIINDNMLIDKSVVPFPALQYLRLYSPYTFADDTLFRGNNSILKHLDMELDAETMDVLSKYGVLTKGRFPKLHHISMQHYPSTQPTFPIDDFIKLVIDMISPATQILSILAKDGYQSLVSHIPTCPYAGNIQILTMHSSSLSLLEIINIVKLLPNMTDLTCSFNDIDPELHAISDQSIPDHLYSQYYPLSNRLKCWHVRLTPGISHESVAVSAVALGVLCHSLTFVEVLGNVKEFNDSLTSLLDSEQYGEQPDRVKRLFV